MQSDIILYKKFGRCLKITDGKTEAYVTLDIGPRIIKFNAVGKENLLYNDDEIKGEQDVSSLFGEGKKWHTYGGHRFWTSPEKFPDTYYPDNDKVEYEIKDGKVILMPNEQIKNNVRHRLEVSFDKDGNFVVEHFLTNTGKVKKYCGIWGITVTDKNGIAIIKQPEKNDSLLPNRRVAFWPYTKMNDKRLLLGDKYIAIQQNPDDVSPAKFGFDNSFGVITLFNKEQKMTISYKPDYENGVYPDFNVSTETYLNGNILELETLGHISYVEPNQTVTHTETWNVVPSKYKPSLDENSIESVFEK